MPERPLRHLPRLLARWRLWKPARLVEEARQAIERGDHTRAAVLLHEANRLAPAWPEPLYLLGRCARASGDREEEERSLLAALECDPEHVEAERALLEIRAWRLEPVTRAWHLFHGGRFEEALAAFRCALEETGTRLPLWTRAGVIAGIGWCHEGMGNPGWGAEAFVEALALDPNIAHAHKGLGICRYRLGDYPGAELVLYEALRLQPKYFDALAFLGWCAYETGRFEEARDRFQGASRGNPLIGDARWGLAWSLWRLEQVEEAKHAFREAFEREPDHPSSEEVEKWVLAEPRYDDLREAWAGSRTRPGPARPTPPPSPLLDALAALIEGRPDECLSLLDELEDHSPGDAWRARWLRGRANLELNQLERALASFDKARELAPGREEPLLWRSRVLDTLQEAQGRRGRRGSA